MKVGTTAETNEKKKKTILGLILLTVLCAIIFSILFKQFIILFTWFIKLIIKNYVYILIGIAAILIGRKILFRSKRK